MSYGAPQGKFAKRVDKQKDKYEDEICPVCGYYCLGKSGYGCIDKPSMVRPKGDG